MEDGFALRREWIKSQERAEMAFKRCYMGIDDYVDAEADYQIAKAHALDELITDGVHSQTTANNMVKGVPSVSQAFKRRIKAKETLQTDREAARYWSNVEAHRFKEYEIATKESSREHQ